MNEIVLKRLEQKIQESISNKKQITYLAKSVSTVDDSTSLVQLGIITGRLYNAFYYQTKRILGREPTKDEFEEFVQFLKEKRHMLVGVMN